jgi:dipeptidase
MNNYGPDYLESPTYPDRSIYNWSVSVPMMFIDQVPHTYAYTLGLYGIQNEHQLSIGESTTGSPFIALPLSQGGKAAMKMETLTELAMERCATAKCAVLLIGELATKYGFYGGDGTKEEAGEALTISDPNEVWYVGPFWSALRL